MIKKESPYLLLYLLVWSSTGAVAGTINITVTVADTGTGTVVLSLILLSVIPSDTNIRVIYQGKSCICNSNKEQTESMSTRMYGCCLRTPPCTCRLQVFSLTRENRWH